MSTEPTPTQDPRPTQPTTEIAARGRSDPWADDDASPGAAPTARVQRQFEPYSLARMRNLMDDENAYCN